MKLFFHIRPKHFSKMIFISNSSRNIRSLLFGKNIRIGIIAAKKIVSKAVASVSVRGGPITPFLSGKELICAAITNKS